LSLDMVRVEYGLLFYGYDMDRSNNPFEMGLDHLVSLNGPDYIGKAALQAIRDRGVEKRIVGLEIAAPAAVGGGTVLDGDGHEVGAVSWDADRSLATVTLPSHPVGDRMEVTWRLSRISGMRIRRTCMVVISMPAPAQTPPGLAIPRAAAAPGVATQRRHPPRGPGAGGELHLPPHRRVGLGSPGYLPIYSPAAPVSNGMMSRAGPKLVASVTAYP